MLANSYQVRGLEFRNPKLQNKRPCSAGNHRWIFNKPPPLLRSALTLRMDSIMWHRHSGSIQLEVIKVGSKTGQIFEGRIESW